MNPPVRIVVTGDVTIDWHVARLQEAHSHDYRWDPASRAHASGQRGGAALSGDLVASVAAALAREGRGDFEVRTPQVPLEGIAPGDPRYHHSYALWARYEEGGRRAWRVEEFLGLDDCASGPASAGDFGGAGDPDGDGNPGLLVLDDAGLGFRDEPTRWPSALRTPEAKPWIVLKTSRPVAEGPLWRHLLQHHSDRLIVVMTVNDLRLTEVAVSRALSWERTAQDLVWELLHTPRVNGLSRCAHVVVSFDTAGALLLSHGHEGGAAAAPKATLLFDPEVIEGEWAQRYPGGMIGYTSCLAAGIARQVMLQPEDPDVLQGIQTGVAAMRALHHEGYGTPPDTAAIRLTFPLDRITAELASPQTPLATAHVDDPARLLHQAPANDGQTPPERFWAILRDRYAGDLYPVARDIVLRGPEAALTGVPIGRFGSLLTVDRREIEAFRSIRALMSEYCTQETVQRPLSIAVFGAPGSGKSFGVMQVAKSLQRNIQSMTFNLSQLQGADGLVDTLHQVRDAGLSDKLPLVFWDEFDTPLDGQLLGWLRCFLAPMQDGTFQHGQLAHPIGRAIFVFVGGLYSSYASLGSELSEEQRRSAKVPDFVSRLRGFVDILGPDASDKPNEEDDRFWMMRRAVLLRSILWRDRRNLFRDQAGYDLLQIDQGVLRAFLQAPRYHHGARSMEALVAMSQVNGRDRFERSSLPSEHQLSLHVEPQAFLALVHQLELDGDLLETLARAAHDVFCEGLQAAGYVAGNLVDDQRKTHALLGKGYLDLDAKYQDANRDTVRRIPAKLAAIGYAMVPARGNEAPLQFTPADVEQMAEIEHDRWLRHGLDSGWRWGEQRDDVRKLHPSLLLWSQATGEVGRHPTEFLAAIGPGALTEEDKEKDRVLVRGIPSILAQAGYTIVKVRPGGRPALGATVSEPSAQMTFGDEG